MTDRPPFERTACGCDDCVACCERQPGHLAPGDLERIADFLGGDPDAVALTFFVASPGAVARIAATGQTVRIGTITPGTDAGRCRFFDPVIRGCRIHEVAPFGCAFFDTHMSAREGAARSLWGIHQIVASPEYSERRDELPEATTWNPTGYE